MAQKNILVTDLHDPLLAEVLFHYLRRTEDLIFCIGRPLQLPAKFDTTRFEQRVKFIELQDSELRVDELWHSSMCEHALDEELLNLIRGGWIPVVNYIQHNQMSWERAQALALLYPNQSAHRSPDDAKFLEACLETGFSYRIFEPSNLVDIHGRWPVPVMNDFYSLLGQLVSFKKDIEEKIEGYFQRCALKIRSNLTMNLLSIEEAAQRVFDIATSGDTLNGSFQIASPMNVSLKNYLDVLAQHIGMQIEHVSPVMTLDSIDAVFESEISVTQSDSEETAEVEEADTSATIQSFLENYVNTRPVDQEISELLESREVRLENGEMWSYYAGGRGDRTIVVVNAYGQGFNYWTRLVRQLSETYRLVVWCPRGSGPEHRADLRRVLANECVERAEFLGWCTSPKFILDYYSRHPEQVSSMTFLGATFKNLPGQAQLDTDFERGLEPLLKMVHDRPQLAGRLKDALRAVLLAGKRDEQTNSTSTMQLLGFPCPDLKEAVIGPFTTDEGLVNYARRILEFWNHDASKLFENVRVPVLFISGECDRIASPRMAQAAARLIPGARYVELKGGSHYLQFEKHSLTACIIDQFLRDAMARRLTNTIVLTQKGSAHTWLKTKTLATVS
jgi:pimeloyl-ACP methyl ester carboxylesterase